MIQNFCHPLNSPHHDAKELGLTEVTVLQFDNCSVELLVIGKEE